MGDPYELPHEHRHREGDTAWRDLAACRGEDPRLFFPATGDPVRQARAICAACPVRIACLRYALADPVALRHGIWGGTTPRHRREIRRRTAAERRRGAA